jgi:hypothetical protein
MTCMKCFMALFASLITEPNRKVTMTLSPAALVANNLTRQKQMRKSYGMKILILARGDVIKYLYL